MGAGGSCLQSHVCEGAALPPAPCMRVARRVLFWCQLPCAAAGYCQWGSGWVFTRRKRMGRMVNKVAGAQTMYTVVSTCRQAVSTCR
jgi:hypothetical protein